MSWLCYVDMAPRIGSVLAMTNHTLGGRTFRYRIRVREMLHLQTSSPRGLG